MKAAVLNKIGARFEIEDITVDEPRGAEVLVDVKGSALCHSDLSVSQNDYGHPMPAVLGHEVAGVVAAVGPLVGGLRPGDKVVGCLTGFCGQCEECVSGQIWMCARPGAAARGDDLPPRLSRAGTPVTQVSGLAAFAEQMLVHESNLVKVHDDVPLVQAALLGCGVITGAGAAINTAKIRFGDTVAVIGCGGVGLSTIQGAALCGAAQIIAIDTAESKLELSRRFGATDTVLASKDDAVNAVLDLTGGKGVQHSFEVVGSPGTAKQALSMLRRGGVAYMIGMQRPGTELVIDPFADLVLRQRSVHGVYMGSTNFKKDIPHYAQLYVQGRFNLDDLVSQTIGLEDINDAYDDLQAGRVIRSVIAF
ncbi:Alcohol dehydrogenase [Frankia canadensis]|uniref:Alcohol dehydrogenase n=1 Tax=Frankia canadensis TaxID=1836972 RepID=A0A2I2KHX2_9ACTN|nr:Zn-dependent alcohol dehydrogenase [Frankia canadensis]SNQ45267.1 Alcohol dehydrogenase [Frankia canadensis]SOU52557.1 Alcohol dehydrogenase [Frankia canadensis]